MTATHDSTTALLHRLTARPVVAILRAGHINVSKTNWIDRFVYS